MQLVGRNKRARSGAHCAEEKLRRSGAMRFAYCALRRAPQRHRLDREDYARRRHRVTVHLSAEPDLSFATATADRKRLVAADAELRAAGGMECKDFRHVTTPCRPSAQTCPAGNTVTA